VAGAEVVDQLAEAWCDRQRSCDRVGAGQAYATYFDCVKQTRTAGRRDLDSLRCPHGIDSTRAQACVAAIGRQPCSDDVIVLLAPEQCRGADLCVE
jgi:Family of unknown function (DUF6184)